jgi:hypothetical protein
MKQERYNIFQQTHKNLGCLVFDAGAGLQKTDNCSAEEISLVLEKMHLAIRYFEYHIRREDNLIYNAVASVAPYIISEMEKVNGADMCQAWEIESKIEKLSLFAGKCVQENVNSLRTSFYAFTAAVLLHINKEETVINQLLWDIYSDQQLREMHHTIHDNLAAESKRMYSGQFLQTEIYSESNNDPDLLMSGLYSMEAA